MMYRTGRHWGVTIVQEDGEGSGQEGGRLVAVVVNGDQELAERIARLLTHDSEARTSDEGGSTLRV